MDVSILCFLLLRVELGGAEGAAYEVCVEKKHAARQHCPAKTKSGGPRTSGQSGRI